MADYTECCEALAQLSPHILIVFAIVIVGCLCVFVVLFFRSDEAAPSQPPVPGSVAGLSAAKLDYVDVLFCNSDFQKLKSRPELRPVCAKLRRDRRRIALLWVAELRSDVRLVWEFRRFLVLNDLAVTFGEEIEIGCTACIVLFYLNAVRVGIVLSGPFFLGGALRTAQSSVQWLSHRGARLLARVPAAVRTQLEEKWAKHVLTLNPV